MKKLHFDYSMQITYTQKVADCHFTIKGIQADNHRQHPKGVVIEILPENRWSRGVDSFGNQMVYGSVGKEHDRFLFHISGDVTTGILEYEPAEKESLLSMYRYPYGLTKPGPELTAYYNSLKLEEKASVYEKGVFLMHKLYQDFSYEKNITDIGTSAEEAFRIGRGVCQDYAHILIALCHMAGIPARYVTGMLIGEGDSHAWVEILMGDRWYAVDPTNDVIVTDSHIKIGMGRDASDCMINRGILRGGGSQTQWIHVSVEEVP